MKPFIRKKFTYNIFSAVIFVAITPLLHAGNCTGGNGYKKFDNSNSPKHSPAKPPLPPKDKKNTPPPRPPKSKEAGKKN